MKFKLLTLAIIVALVVAGAYSAERIELWLDQQFAADEQRAVPTMRIEPRTYRIIVPAEGELTGLSMTPVQAPRVRRGSFKIGWVIEEGQIVEAGDLLIRFDNTDAAIALEKNQNTVSSFDQQISKSESDNETEGTVLSLDREQAEAELQYAENQVRQDERIFSEWEIRESIVSAALAAYRKDNIDAKGGLRSNLSSAGLEILRIDQQKAQSEVDVARETLSSLEVRAPVPGIVIFKRRGWSRIEVGAEVWPGSPILDLAAPFQFQGELNVDEKEITGIEPGRKVSLALGSFPGQIFSGSVKSVAKAPQQQSRNDPRKYFSCQVVLDVPIDVMRKLKPGMRILGEIEIAERREAFIVPKSAVIRKDEEFAVYLAKAEEFERRLIEIVDSDHGFYIIQGVSGGDRLALRNPFEDQQLHLPDFNAPAARTSGRRFIVVM